VDGFAAAAGIREMDARTGRHTPVIAVTAHALDGDRERCLAAGMDGYIAKPYGLEQLRNVLAAYAPATPAEHETSVETPL
jgi:CheY-like chemotaxis protein